MRKTLLGPDAGELEASDVDHMQYSIAVATEHESHRRVVFSGFAWPEGDVENQTREVLAFLERALEDVGGALDDVVLMRWFVVDEHLSRETQASINDVRSEYFDAPHYPASTMVGVSSLLEEGMVFELEVEAEVPDEDWTTTAFVGEESEEVSGETVAEMLGGDETEPPANGDA